MDAIDVKGLKVRQHRPARKLSSERIEDSLIHKVCLCALGEVIAMEDEEHPSDAACVLMEASEVGRSRATDNSL